MTILIDHDNNSLTTDITGTIYVNAVLDIDTISINGNIINLPSSSGQMALYSDVIGASGNLQSQLNAHQGTLVTLTGVTGSFNTTITNLQNQITTNDNNAVHDTGTEIISGQKSFVNNLTVFGDSSLSASTFLRFYNQASNSYDLAYDSNINGGGESGFIVDRIRLDQGRFDFKTSSDGKAEVRVSAGNGYAGSSKALGFYDINAGAFLFRTIQNGIVEFPLTNTSANSLLYLSSTKVLTPSPVFVTTTNDITTTANIFSDNIFSTGCLVLSGDSPISGNSLTIYGEINPMKLVSEFRDEFLTGIVGSTLGWASVNSGTGAISQSSNVFGFTSGEKALGVWQLTTGTTSAGRANINLGTSGATFGYAGVMQKWRVGFDTLSSSANRYVVRIGFIDSTTNSDATNGVYFEYDEGTGGNVWRVCTSSNSIRTKTNTSTAIQTSSFDRLWIYVDPFAVQANFYINETAVGTISTNVPNITGRRFTGPGMSIIKTTGTTARNVYVDYFYMRFTGNRS